MVMIDSDLFPVKSHYFFFMAAMGPILPFVPVMGKQLGLSEVAMGLILSVMPLLFMVAKPTFGFILDYYQYKRKSIFIVLVLSTTVFFTLLEIIPQYKGEYFHQQTECSSIGVCSNKSDIEALCHMQNITVHVSEDYECSTVPFTCPSLHVNLLCVLPSKGLYSSGTFWLFVILFSIGSVCYNVANSVSDAICFDVLGSGEEKKYGQQRVWGTIGFGLSALLGGYCVDWWSGPGPTKDYTPAFLIAAAFISLDMICCYKLKLPELPKSSNIIKDVTNLMRSPSIVTFLVFAAFLGICESFIIFFLFWYLEDLALVYGTMHNIKLIQGFTVAAETLIGEVVFFPLSGRILGVLGYRHCMSLCFVVYAVRLGLLSLLTNPWWAVAIEVLQGPSYALSYTTVVAYASAISPPGTSATVQGIAAGVDDGFGYSVGSLAGGLLYKVLGGSISFQVFSVFALACSFTHFLLYLLFFRHTGVSDPQTLGAISGVYSSPKEAAESVVTASVYSRAS